MDYKSYKVFNFLLKNRNQSISSLKLKFPKYDIENIHNYLHELGLIKNNNGNILITWKGKTYKEMIFRNSFKHLFWTLISVIVGFLLGRI